MQKHLLMAALFVVLPLSTAQAAFYGGLDFDADSVTFNSSAPNQLPDGQLGLGAHVGYHFDNLAAELGYGTTRSSYFQEDLRFNRLTLDGIYYIPIGGFLNLLVTGGGSQTNYGASSYIQKSYMEQAIVKTTRVPTTVLSGDEFDWRAGAGFSFQFSHGYELHVIGRYEPLTMNGIADNALSVGVGFNIEF